MDHGRWARVSADQVCRVLTAANTDSRPSSGPVHAAPMAHTNDQHDELVVHALADLVRDDALRGQRQCILEESLLLQELVERTADVLTFNAGVLSAVRVGASLRRAPPRAC